MASLLPGPLRNRRTLPDPDDYRLSLIDHLTELRDRVFRSVVAIAVLSVAGWFIEPDLYKAIESTASRAIRSELPKNIEYKAVFHTFTEPFMLQLRLSFLIGLALAFPFILIQIWGFVAPGLKESERKPFQKLAPWSALLFFMGAGFAGAVMPEAFKWFATFVKSFPDTSLYQEPGVMTLFTIKMLAAFGVGFQLPIIVYGLGMAGLLTGETLMQNWRQAATGIFVAAMIITPSNDVFSMLMMAIPLVCLFGISVVAVRGLEKAKAKREKIPEFPIE